MLVTDEWHKETGEWYNEWQRVTTSDNEWQRVTMNGNEWQQIETSNIEWYSEWQRMKTNESKLKWL